jgi:hypothetical protein
MKYAKGVGPVSARYACGGPSITTKSRFFKSPDVFRGERERSDYGGKTDPLAKESGETKALKPIKPRT